MHLNLFTDGGSRGNPGKAGYGYVVYDVTGLANPTPNLNPSAGIILKKCGKYLGIQTNNQAEYEGLEAGISWVVDHHPDSNLQIYMDSLLIVNQIKGLYRVKHPILNVYFLRIKDKLAKISSYNITHIPRHFNSMADSLANLAMDKGR